jgi:hypothetical protein
MNMSMSANTETKSWVWGKQCNALKYVNRQSYESKKLRRWVIPSVSEEKLLREVNVWNKGEEFLVFVNFNLHDSHTHIYIILLFF